MGSVAKFVLYDKAEDRINEGYPTSFFDLEANDINGNHIAFSIYQ